MHAATALNFRQARTLAMTTHLRHAIGLLRYTNLELAAHLLHEAPGNPFLEIRDPGAALPASPGGERSGTLSGWENLPSPAPGLVQHVADQISLEIRKPGHRRIAFAFLDALEPHGWLGCSVEEIAETSRCSLPEAGKVLSMLQAFDPPGLFARSLAECLRLQAQDRGRLDSGLDMLLGHLELLAARRICDLAAICGVTEDRIHAYARLIRSFDPKPGAAFSSGHVAVAPPDLIVSSDGEGWSLELNATTLPDVMIREDLVPESRRRDAFVAEALVSARGLKRAIEQRNANTLAVASEMVRRQPRFLKDGSAALAPMTMRDVADAVSLHESTVSRITAGLTLATPRGLVTLRALFCRGLPGREDAVSVHSVCNCIRAMIMAERPGKPLSDAQITSRLKAEGLGIERRTVAKYRGAIGIPSSSRRRAMVPQTNDA